MSLLPFETPNPAIELASSSRPRLLAAAAHVKRLDLNRNIAYFRSMKKKLTCLLFSVIAPFASPAAAQEFDWKLLEGKWAESAQHKFGCRPDNLHQYFEVSPDKKTLVFKNDRKWKVASGHHVESYSATILKALPNMLIIKYGPDLPGIPDHYREWEMRFIGPGTYRWRATVWPEGEYNDVVGVRCQVQ